MQKYGDFKGSEKMKKEIKKLNYGQLLNLKFYIEEEMKVQDAKDRRENARLRKERILRNKQD